MIVSLAEKKARSLPQTPDTWLLGVRRAPVWVGEDGAPRRRPWAVLVVSRRTGQIRFVEMLEERPSPEAVLERVLRAMSHPAPSVREKVRPTQLGTDVPEVAAFLRPRLKTLGIRVSSPGRLEALDEVFRNLEGAMNGRPALPGLGAASGVEDAWLGEFFEAAAAYYRAAPWTRWHDAVVLEIRYPAGAAPRYATVLGAEGQVFGLALYPSREDLALVHSARDPAAAAGAMRSVAVWFSPEHEVPFADLDEMEGKRWPVAGPEAYPVAVKMDPDDGADRPDADELRLLAAGLRGVAALASREMAPGGAELPLPAIHGARRVGVALAAAGPAGEMPRGARELLEDFVGGWHHDEASHRFALEAGAFLLGFLAVHLAPRGLSPATMVKHQENAWWIGRLATAVEGRGPFTPALFDREPRYVEGFRRLASRAESRARSYLATWNHLRRYARSFAGNE